MGLVGRARWCAAVAGCLLAAAARATEPDPFLDCAAAVESAPTAYESSLCFFSVAAETGDWAGAAARLAQLEASHPQIGWVRLVRAHVAWSAGDHAAEALYRSATDRFVSDGNLRGELVARSNLRTLLHRLGRVDEAAAEVERIAEIAEITDDEELRVRALVDQARHDIQTGTNLGRAETALLRASGSLQPAHAYWLRKEILHGLGVLDLQFGRHAEAIETFRELAELAARNDDLPGVAQARFDVANATYEYRVEVPREDGHAEVRRQAAEALSAARRAQAEHVEVLVHRLLAELLIHEDPERAERHAGECRALAERLGEPGILSECLWTQARLAANKSAPDDGPSPRALIQRAVSLMEEYGDPSRLSHAWRHQMRISWQTRPLAQAIADGEQALEVFEALRELQHDEQGRTGVLSAWARDYYWLAGRLLEQAEREGDEAMMARAFAVAERMRARTLLEALVASTPVRRASGSAEQERAARLEQIVELNRRLLGIAASGAEQAAEREAILLELDALELRERELRAAERADIASIDVPHTALAEVRDTLAADEALLAFQIGPWTDVSGDFGGGAWLLVVTREGSRALRLPGRTRLADSTSVALGLIRSGADSAADVEVALYQRLLRDAVDSLPEQVHRLIIVPDYPLHGFPLATLRRSPDGPRLGERFELTFVPSATLWRHWRTGSSEALRQRALILANPALPGAADARAAQWRSWALDAGLQLGPLPFAEAEGRAALRQLDGSRLFIGEAASEAVLKEVVADGFGILHLATHAVVDQVHPERSAVVLSPGSDQQDGLLQIREIVELPLDGHVVVLSSCQSATGVHLRGEGVQSLARAFFAAGAAAVIGSLWPMRDDHAAAFFEVFYRALASGQSAGAAVQTAQRTLAGEGLPTAAWAGFQLLGDGTVTAAARPAPRSSVWWWVAVAATLVAAGIVWRRRRRFPTAASAVRLRG